MSLLFYDSEFTGLNQNTTLISVAFVSEEGKFFYAEFTDYNREQVDSFIQNEVLRHTLWLSDSSADLSSARDQRLYETGVAYLGTAVQVKRELLDWFSQFDSIQIWADHVAYDWILLCELFGGALDLPGKVHYIPFDLCTLFHCQGLDADVDRISFIKSEASSQLRQANIRRPFYHNAIPDVFKHSHNALFDAAVALDCYRSLRS